MPTLGTKIKTWTAKEVLQLREWRAGTAPLTLDAIARRLGRTKASVKRRLHDLGIKVHQQRKPYELQRKVKAVWKPGLSDCDIARKLGLATAVVQRARSKAGLPSGMDRKKVNDNIRLAVTGKRPRCWGCNRTSGMRSPRWMEQNGWYYQEYRFRSGEGHQSDNECYCPECWKLTRVFGMAGDNRLAGHSPPAGAGTRIAPTKESSPNRLACASGTG